MAAILTIDGQNGPGLDLEGTVFNGVTTFTIDVDKSMISFDQPPGNTVYISIPVISAISVGITANKVATVSVVD